MNLIELYDSLSFPDGDEKFFNAIPIPGYPSFRVAVDIEGNPILLLSVGTRVKNPTLKNFRLQYLKLEQELECKVSDNGRSNFQTFTAITFTCLDRDLQEYFLRISEILIRTLRNKPTQIQVTESLTKFVEVFRALSDPPIKTVQGLWTELFLIDNSRNASALLDYWHNAPEEKFDFNSGEEKIEVKSNSKFERVHIFSAEQLNPPLGTHALIASIFTKESKGGMNIQDLVNSICSKMQDDIEKVSKLNSVVGHTLGNSLQQSMKLKFDCEVARDSLQFYEVDEVMKIEKENIPSLVSNVRFASDLSNLPVVNLKKLQSRGLLFNHL